MPANNKIRSAYVTLPSAERKVADFILDNPDRAMRMVINEIAEAAGVSVPSVTRLAGGLDTRASLISAWRWRAEQPQTAQRRSFPP